uniref:Uncharacterized protein n=1 Tax=Sphaerodactylus townsendi TaxID=933632 RepID=A0ACB8E5K6_9SAUR
MEKVEVWRWSSAGQQNTHVGKAQESSQRSPSEPADTSGAPVELQGWVQFIREAWGPMQKALDKEKRAYKEQADKKRRPLPLAIGD